MSRRNAPNKEKQDKHSEFEWKKYPSVWTGGKPYFLKMVGHDLWVTWDRAHKSWSLKTDKEDISFHGEDEKAARVAGLVYARANFREVVK